MSPKTLRQQIIALIEEAPMDARGLSAALRVREKEIYGHLVHVQRTVAAGKRRFVIHPSTCVVCGFKFAKRRRLTRPSRCPRCKSARLSQPQYEIR